MAYKRTVTIDVGGTVLVMDDGSGSGSESLDCSFLTRQATIQSSMQSEVRVYNVAPDTAHAIPESGGVVTLSAGYADEGTDVIFKGELKQRRIGREDRVRTFVDLFCAGGDNAYNFATISKKVASGSKPSDHLDAALQEMQKYGITEGYVDRSVLSSPQYPRSVQLYGMARDVLRSLATKFNADWWIRDQQLYFVGKQGSVPGTVTLNSTTGLIGQPTETPGGIEVRMLLSGKVGVGSILSIDSSSIQQAQLDQSYAGPSSTATNALKNLGTADGTYKVLYLERQGRLRGQEWYNNMVCIGSKTGVQPQSLSNVIGGDATTPNFSGQGGAGAGGGGVPGGG